MYELEEKYLLGVKEIDEQHRKLFELTDEAYHLLTDENMLYKCSNIRMILGGIEEFAEKHFQTEEAYMEKNGYEGLEEHKKFHEAFTQKVREFDDHVSKLSLGTQDDMLLQLLDYLVSWLQNHIYEEDRKYLK